MNLWNDLVVGNDRIVSREEIEFEIAVNDELLERREALYGVCLHHPIQHYQN